MALFYAEGHQFLSAFLALFPPLIALAPVKIQLRVRSLGTREERTEDDGSGPGRFVTIHVEVIAHRTPMCQRRISLAIRL